jgi:type 1 glutamine amidotransferase
MTDKKDEKPKGNKGASRRKFFGAAAGAAASIPLLAQAQQPAPAPAQAPAAGGRGAAAAGGRGGGGRGAAQGGTGPIKVLFVSKYHQFDREGLATTLDALGTDISWTHVEHPAAEAFYDPKVAAPFDVLLFYDAFAGREVRRRPDGSSETIYNPPSAQTQANLKALLQAGNKGFVFFHHAIASWVHAWPPGINGSNAYVEVMGAAADWGTPIKNIRGVDYPPSGAGGGTQQHITVVDKTHPITAGVEDFDIIDETYLCPIFEDSVHPLLRTDFKPVDTAFPNRPQVKGHPPGSNLTGWYKAAERSPVAYIQHGHDQRAWENPAFRKLMLNAIKWAASPESKAWARANEKRIFR